MKAAVILSGCGFLDGSEVHEATLLLLALEQKRVDATFFSLDKEIEESISHLSKEPIEHKRNMMEMSARISRGEILSVKNLRSEDYDILAMPGGYGVAKNLSNWAELGIDCMVEKEILRVIRDFFAAKKIIIGMCIAPMIIGKALEGSGIKMTPGSDSNHLKTLASLGIEAISCTISEACIDQTNRVYTVPAYMEPPDIAGIYESLKKIQEVL